MPATSPQHPRLGALALGLAAVSGCLGRVPSEPLPASRHPADGGAGDSDDANGDTPTNLPPDLAAVPFQTVDEGGSLTFTLVAVDPEGDALTYACAANCPPGLTVAPTTGVVSFSPDYSQAGGWAGVTFTASDRTSVASRVTVITVVNVIHYQGWIGIRETGLASAGFAPGGTSQAGNSDGGFVGPARIAVDGVGSFYVTDPASCRLLRFDRGGAFNGWTGRRLSDGQPTGGWAFGDAGQCGNEDGTFSLPDGLAADAGGLLYVADHDNWRIVVLDSSGTFVRNLGLEPPIAVAATAEGTVYATSTSLSAVLRLNASGTLTGRIGAVFNPMITNGWSMSDDFTSSGHGDGMLCDPYGVAASPSGSYLYVADYGNFRVDRFASDGTFQGWIGEDTNGQVTSGWTFGDAGEWSMADGGFNSVRGIAVNPTGDLFVTDANQQRVQKFDAAGLYLGTIGSGGTGDGELSGPTGIALDPAGNIYVGELARVSHFSGAGTFLGWIGRKSSDLSLTTGWTTGDSAVAGTPDGAFDWVTGLAIDAPGDRLYVAEYGNERVQIFVLSTGAWVSSFPVAYAYDVKRDAAGNLYVSRFDGHGVDVYDGLSSLQRTIGSYGFGAGQFVRPAGLALVGTTLYVVDNNWTTTGERLQRFGTDGTDMGWTGKYGPLSVTPGWQVADEIEENWAAGAYVAPRRLAFDQTSDRLYVGDFDTELVSEIEGSTGAYLRQFTPVGGRPFGVGVSPTLGVLVTTEQGFELYDQATLTLQGLFGSPGSGDAQLSSPGGIVVDGFDILVIDGGNSRVQKW